MDGNLKDLQQAQGAIRHQPDSTIANFGDPRAEYAAAVGSAALFDVTGRTQLELRGSDRQQFLNNFCTNDVKSLGPGGGCEAFLLNVKGRVLGHVFAFAGENALWIDSVPGAGTFLQQHLDRYLISEDVQLEDFSDRWAAFYCVGPHVADVLDQAGLPGSRELRPSGHLSVEHAGRPVAVRRIDFLRVPAYQLVFPMDAAADVWQGLIDGGANPAGNDVLETLRIEACFPLYGVDASDQYLAQELARNREAISFTKGCYLGQEPVARIDAMGHVNRELRGLKLAAATCPPAGSPVMPIGGDKQIGEVTSCAFAWNGDQAVALAYLRSTFTEPGTEVCVQTSRGPIVGTVYARTR